MSEIPAADDFSAFIALRQQDRLHGLVGWRGDALGNPSAKCWTWIDNTKTLQEHPLPGWETYLTSGCCAFFGDNQLALVGFYKAGGVGPPRIAEYSMGTDPFTLTNMFDFGDQDTRNPMCIQTNSGGVLIVGYQHQGPQIFLKTAYRRPSAPPPPSGALPSPWAFQDFVFTQPTAEIPAMNYTMAQQPDGSIWLFMSRDGSGRFSLATFKEINGALENTGFVEDYLIAEMIDGHLRDGDMSPGEELPPLQAIADRENGRILLCYPQFGSEPICTGKYEHNVITACYPDLTRKLVAKLPNLMWKFRPVGCAWPSAAGVSYMVSGIDPATCLINWHTGQVSDGLVLPDKPIKMQLPEQVAFCSDTFVAFNLEGLLIVIPAGLLSNDQPILSIKKKDDTEIEITISEGEPPFILEKCTDLTVGEWIAVTEPTSERVITQTISGDQAFFRVRMVTPSG